MDVRWRPPLWVAIVTHLVTQPFVSARTACWPGCPHGRMPEYCSDVGVTASTVVTGSAGRAPSGLASPLVSFFSYKRPQDENVPASARIH